MLTEHEQLADHEARINKQKLMQKLPPLQQPLDNIEEIKRQLKDMRRAMVCVDIAAEHVALVMLPTVVKMASEIDDHSFFNKISDDVEEAFTYADAFIAEMKRRKNA